MTVAEVVAAAQASGKYASLCDDVVQSVAVREVAKGRSLKETVKAVKNKLHQIAGAYLAEGTDRDLPYGAWLEELGHAERSTRPQIARRIMQSHTSTRERLPYLDAFMGSIKAAISAEEHVISSVADLACGLQPLVAPLLPLAPGARYFACDLYPAMLDFLGAALPLLGVQAKMAALDLTQTIPTGHFDVAFLLKLIPCLDQLDRAAASRLLEGLDADLLVLSFPTRALGGRNVGMAATYDARLRELLAGRAMTVQRTEFPNEVVYVVRRKD